jgi:hypothetical protein
MCQQSHSAQADFHGMPFGKAEFVAHPSYWQEAVVWVDACFVKFFD